LLFGLAAGLFDTFFPSTIPEALLFAQASEEGRSSSAMQIYVVLVALLVGLVGNLTAIIGLYTFQSWAPRVAVFITSFLIFLSPVIGASVSSGWASALSELSATLWGVVLAIVYFSPLKERFVEKGSQPPFSSHDTLIHDKLAHPGKRFQGQFIDGVIAYFLGFTSFYLLDMLVAREFAFYAGAVIGVSYFLFSDALPNGQSVGKRLLGIQVVSHKTMKSCSVLQSFLRNVTFLFGLFDWAPIFFGIHRRLGDRIASTIVVKKST
jgi:uncharacterized RDD family membrane protein YckC